MITTFSDEASRRIIDEVRWSLNHDKSMNAPDESTYGSATLACFVLAGSFAKADGENEYRAQGNFFTFGGDYTQTAGKYVNQPYLGRGGTQWLWIPTGQKTPVSGDSGNNPLFIPSYNSGQKVWATWRGRWEILPNPPQLYCSMPNETYVADGTTGIVSPGACSLYCYINGVRTSIGGTGTVKIRSLWQSGGYNWNTDSIDTDFKFALIAGHDYPVCEVIDTDDATGAAPTVVVNPGQQTFLAQTNEDITAGTEGLCKYLIKVDGGYTQKMNAQTLVNLNSFYSGVVIPSGTACLLTEQYPGVFYSLLSPQNPVGYIPQTPDSDEVLLQTLQFSSPLWVESGDTTGQPDVTLSVRGLGTDPNPDIGLTVDTSGDHPVIVAETNGFTGDDVSGHAANNGIVQ